MERPNIESTMNEIVQTYNSNIEVVNNYLENAKSKKILVGENQDERTLSAISIEKQRGQVYSLNEKCFSKVNEIIDNYNSKEQEFFTLRGEDMTKDIDLLKLDLSLEQVQELQNRYINNYTMLNSINGYAKNKNYPIKNLQSKNERIDILDSFNKMIKPRYIENTTGEKIKFPFLITAEKYKESYLLNLY